MTEILQSPSHLPLSPSSIPTLNDGLPLHQQTHTLINNPNSYPVSILSVDTEGVGGGVRERKEREKEEGDQLSLLALLVTVFRKSLIACRSERIEELSSSTSTSTSSSSSSSSMEIGLPTNVRHVAHVTFDRFNGFLGLPDEFEPEVPRRPPSASASVFGVSTESMQLSFDSRGNSVPTILLMMQRRLYTQGGLQAEGIFRINGENSQEEYVREQLNTGLVPHDIDVHCLAGLIKAWFRELPNGVLDALPPEHVMQAQSAEECARLVRLLPSTEAALMDWAINLMADVAQMENLNKMNARNIAMVFAPNMTQMADPLTALMYAVQVMNFLKTLIVKTLREREDSIVEPVSSHLEPSDENGHDSSSQHVHTKKTDEVNEEDLGHVWKDPISENSGHPIVLDSKAKTENINQVEEGVFTGMNGVTQHHNHMAKTGQSSNLIFKKGNKRVGERTVVRGRGTDEKNRGTSIISRINSRTERFEAWR